MTGSYVHGSVDGDLVAWGKVITLHTLGRRSGRDRTATLGFLEAPEATLLVAATDADADWALNLIADGRCRVEREGQEEPFVAEELAGDERNAAIAGLILRYGTPSERLGGGPAFRLRPTPERSASSHEVG